MSIDQEKLKAEKAAKARRSIKAVLAQTKAISEEPVLTHAQNILIELKARGFRQHEIANILKTHQVIVSFYANGKKAVSEEHLKALEHMLEEARQNILIPSAVGKTTHNTSREELFANRYEHLSRHLNAYTSISPMGMAVAFLKMLGFNYYEIASMLNQNLSTFNKNLKDDDFDVVTEAHMFDIVSSCMNESDNVIIDFVASTISDSLAREIESLTKQPTTF